MENRRIVEDDATSGRLLIVDGHAYAYRAFFAIRSLTSPTGRATNAIYGFIRMLGKVRERISPTHAVVVWDGGLARGANGAAIRNTKRNAPKCRPIWNSNWIRSWLTSARPTSYPT